MTTFWLIVIGVYLFIGFCGVAALWLLAWSQGADMEWLPVLRTLFGWPYYLALALMERR